MFQNAIKIAQQFTRPIVILSRNENGICSASVAGAFIILNEDGWILTANHIAENILRQLSHFVNNVRSNPNIKLSFYWGRNNWQINFSTIFRNDYSDLAIGQIIAFDKSSVLNYPKFKRPDVNFDFGEMLCKFGYSFAKVDPQYSPQNNTFTFQPNIPFFPIDGIYARAHIKTEGNSVANFIETSTAALPGQSGGADF